MPSLIEGVETIRLRSRVDSLPLEVQGTGNSKEIVHTIEMVNLWINVVIGITRRLMNLS